MRNTITIITLTILTAAAPAIAEASKEENVGVGTGIVVGAIAGGPVGAILGAAAGAKLGDTLFRKNERIEHLSASLDASEQRAAALNTDIDTLTAELERLEHVARPELVKLLEAGIAMDLLFRTDEHVLTDTTGNRLAQFAGVLSQMPGIRVRLAGFADERGDEAYNLELSKKRVEFVRDQLIAAGIAPERIRTSALGESPAVDATPDSYALERRVSMTVFIDESPSFASQ
ncbi:MAG: OmpA family protein [Woeseiaceae bacterium]|nr:OmpA family protein [Woeseiaceae bacterium]